MTNKDSVLEAYGASTKPFTTVANVARKILEANDRRVFLSVENASASVVVWITLGWVAPTGVGQGILCNDVAGPYFRMGPSDLCWKGPVWLFTNGVAGVLTVTEYSEGEGRIEPFDD